MTTIQVNTVRVWTPDEAGCLISGHQGWHGHAYMVDLAVASGYPISEEDAVVLERYRTGQGDLPGPHADERMLEQGGLMDRAEAWMNEHCAPDGYSFGWCEGEFFLAHDRWWSYECEVGYDRDNNGDPVAVDIHGEEL